jgi:class 3 adenylate cyclase
MTEGSINKRLAAILHADVAGYARLTDEFEEDTHRLLSQYLDRITELIEDHNGEVSNFAGDAVLAVFPTAVATLRCALAIQRTVSELNAPLPEERRVQFRIGINVGDIIQDRDDVYGNGVNVAARLESLAEPGGICISEAAQDAIGTKLPLRYQFLGEKKVKNIKRPIRLYRVIISEEDEQDEFARKRRRVIWAGALLVAAAVIAQLAVLWFYQGGDDIDIQTVAPNDALSYEDFMARIPGTEKGTWQHDGQWVWFAEYFGPRSEPDGKQPLHGSWGYVRSGEPVEEYAGKWAVEVPIDGHARQCTYYEPEFDEECFTYYRMRADAAPDIGDTEVLLRFRPDGTCEGVSYFEPGDTTDEPMPEQLTSLVGLSRGCSRLRAPTN